ncbi:MAG: hypothetical protein H6938_05850 [Burkholderiales bacterium]|nr:hypothetical protein [Burkholderiales bacterium]
MLMKWILIVITAVLTAVISPAMAAGKDNHELHSEDIQPWRIGAEIFVNSMLFEADFGDLGGGLFATDDPGVDVNVQQGAFTPGNWLRFRPVGQLLYWNGAQWLESTPNGERIEITDALNNAITFHANGVSEIAGVIGEIDSNGGLHEHLNFKILDASNTPNGSPGAYRIQLKLFESTPQSDTSVSIAAAPIAIVLNRGLTSENFESAIVVAAGLDDNAAFVAETGTLTIQRVRAFGAYYKVKLQYNENNQFQLIGAEEITAKD